MIPFPLLSPVTGAPLKADTRHSLAGEGGERWPVVDGIAYLRTGRAGLVAEALAHLDGGRKHEALSLLLREQDSWWTGPAADPRRIDALIENRASLDLRQAVDLLGWGRVGDYFVHRWSDPTYLAGLALLEAHWNRPKCVFELACGIGHYLRELQMRGFQVSGGDVVFAKLWVARHWVLEPGAQLVCFDAASGWPVAGAPVDLVMCHDAFYFLEPKPEILACMRAMAGEEGWLVVSHIHNAARPGHSAGSPVSAAEIDELFPDGLVYDDHELTRALAEARAPVPHPAGELGDAEAFSVVFGPGMRPAPRALKDGLTLPVEGAALVRNPLYVEEPDGSVRIAWPSERYRDEYEPRATYPMATGAPARAAMSPEVEAFARTRELVHLPERW